MTEKSPELLLPIAQTVANAKGWDGATRAIMLAGKQLIALPESVRTESSFVPGCESKVWVARVPFNEFEGGLSVESLLKETLSKERHEDIIAAYSPSKIIRGVLAVLLEKANSLSDKQRKAYDFAQYMSACNLQRHLSQSRGNGILSVLRRLNDL
ncbi:SufE family protein [Alteromonas sp. 1_MG-2023]|uniref:SufE family protein n=1 Tax=Alteromonas sp. 1_MG-2023 TaxID=3062669 RepID=UPI0026E2C953|nr:SufE family protein [Alteromonas sp. 1_MG-2023]MDO6567527.1 SufE family protein [Alteromonas sp. 1_MG-2023]